MLTNRWLGVLLATAGLGGVVYGFIESTNLAGLNFGLRNLVPALLLMGSHSAEAGTHRCSLKLFRVPQF